MKKYFFLTMLLVGLMACSTAPPPPDVFSDSQRVTQTITGTEIPLVYAFYDAALTKDYSVNSGKSFANRLSIEAKKEKVMFVAQVREVPHEQVGLVISVDNLSANNNLYASLSAGYQEISEPPNETIGNSLGFFQEHWISLLVGLLAFGKVVTNLTRTEKDNKVFAWIDSLINGIIPNLKKGGGTHATTG
jgi:hypothetical protein